MPSNIMLRAIMLCDIMSDIMLRDIMRSNIILKAIMLCDIMMSVIMLSDIMMSAIMLSDIMISDIMLNVIMISVIMLNVTVPVFFLGVRFKNCHLKIFQTWVGFLKTSYKFLTIILNFGMR